MAKDRQVSYTRQAIWAHLFVWAHLGAAILFVGCKNESDLAHPRPPKTGDTSAAPHVVERPPTTITEAAPSEISSDSAPQDSWPPVGPQATGPAGSGYSAAANPSFQPSEDITPVPSSIGSGNPLRVETEPEAFSSAAENPLRSFAPKSSYSPQLAPRMAIRAEDWPQAAAPELPGGEPRASDVPFAPETAIPESAFPAAAAPVEAQPAPVAPAPSAGAASPDEPAERESDAMRIMAAAGSADGSAPGDTAVPYDVVQVFYGTDREAIEPVAINLAGQIPRYVPALASVLVTLCLSLVALAKRRASLWALAGCGVVASAVLGLQAANGTLTDIRRSEHEGLRYTSNRAPDGRVQVGICEVAIPKIHAPGELESPSILRGEVKDDAARHVVLAKTDRLGNEQFYEQLRQRVAASPRKEVFIFIHGFNVNFEDAARRTAQIHKDLKFEGAPVFFSWPAHDKFILTYLADANNIPWTVPHLKQFLLEVVHESGAKSINLIAHSMGNRALAATLRELELEFKEDSRFFNQVILAAPDIDSDEFRTVIAPHMQKTANHFTLYASARDEALAASQLAHFGPRAGDAGHGLVVVPGIDTIDVTAIDTSPWGHTYYGSSDPVLRDLGLVIMQGVLPPHRGWLVPAEAGGLPYWVFQPQTTAGRSTLTTPR